MSSVVKDTHHDEHPSGIMRWITTTNHKDIGTLYLWFAMIMFFIGGLMALVIRSELFQPGLQFVDPQFFNSMTTMHALVMIFGVVMPAFTGLANWMIPSRGIGNVGGAMDLAVGAKRVIVAMEHVDKDGNPKLVETCTFPLTCPSSVDLIVTDIAVISVENNRFILLETAPGWSPQDVQDQSGTEIIISDSVSEIRI